MSEVGGSELWVIIARCPKCAASTVSSKYRVVEGHVLVRCEKCAQEFCLKEIP